MTLHYTKALRRYDEYVDIIKVIDDYTSLLSKSIILSTEEFKCFEDAITSDMFGDDEEIQLGKDIIKLLKVYRDDSRDWRKEK